MSAKILVVEDDEHLAKMIRQMLVRADYQVNVAPDGPSALQIARDWEPELVLLDLMLPSIDGFEVCRKMRQIEQTARVPIIMVTARVSISDKTIGFEAGADDYITKPFDNAELKLRITALLKRNKLGAGKTAHRPGQVITVFSLRGGAGSSSLAVNLAVGISRLWGIPVPLVDLGLPTGLCDIMLNVNPKNRLDHLVKFDLDQIDADVIEAHLTRHETGVLLLGGIVAPVKAELVTDGLVLRVLEHLRSSYRYVVIDTAHDFSPPVLAALDGADRILMPLTPDINSMRVGASALEVFSDLGYDEDKKVEVLVNQVFPNNRISKDQIVKAIKHPVSMVIPYAPEAWSESINAGRPVITSDPKLPAVAVLEDLAWRVSTPAERRQQPSKPTEMWQRVARRMK